MLLVGEVCVDQGRILTPGIGDGKRIRVPVPVFLIELPEGQRVLVDTGMHPAHIRDPDHTWRDTELAEFIHPIMHEADLLDHQLAVLGLRIEDITHVVNTHLHFDHAGNNGRFSHATIFVQRRHYEFALGNDLFPNANWALDNLHYELLDGDTTLFPGVDAVVTSGHVPYHQSLVVTLPQSGVVVLCGDAIACQEIVDEDAWDGQMSPSDARRSAARLERIADESDGLLVFGHDYEQWASLRHPPAYYD